MLCIQQGLFCTYSFYTPPTSNLIQLFLINNYWHNVTKKTFHESLPYEHLQPKNRIPQSLYKIVLHTNNQDPFTYMN